MVDPREVDAGEVLLPELLGQREFHQPLEVRAHLVQLLGLLLLEKEAPWQGQESLRCRFGSAIFHAPTS